MESSKNLQMNAVQKDKKVFKVTIFVVIQKSAKSVEIFTFKIFRLYVMNFVAACNYLTKLFGHNELNFWMLCLLVCDCVV